VFKAEVDANAVPEALQRTLDEVSGAMVDRKNEVVDLLCGEQPAKSRQVEMSYIRCTWWEGCYYCQDEANQWHRVKCFI
jgi:hypothetical protein